MRNTLTIISFLYIFGLPKVQAQDFWELLPFPDSINIANIAVNSQGNIFVGTVASNSSNGIYRTLNDGQTWNRVLNTSTFQIYSTGINDSGFLYVSTNGVENFFASFDNGDSWLPIPYPLIAGATRIHCIGSDTVLVASGKGDGVLLLRTPDRGVTWDTLFSTSNHTSEYISDIAIAPDGTIYISLMCFFQNMGGVYKSDDNGITWDFVGLLNHQVKDIEINDQGDLFIGVYSDFIYLTGGIFVLRHNSATIDTCIYGPTVNGLVINSIGHIYAGIGWPDGIIISKDNGLTFEFENSGLPAFPMGELDIDSKDFIYARIDMPSPLLFRSIKPTVTSFEYRRKYEKAESMSISPNPVRTLLNGRITNPTVIANGNYMLYISDVGSKNNKYENINIVENQFQFDAGNLKSGIYFIKVIVGDVIYMSKLVKL